MENGAFAPKQQMLHFPQYFQIQRHHKALLWSKVFKRKYPAQDGSVFVIVFVTNVVK